MSQSPLSLEQRVALRRRAAALVSRALAKHGHSFSSASIVNDLVERGISRRTAYTMIEEAKANLGQNTKAPRKASDDDDHFISRDKRRSMLASLHLRAVSGSIEAAEALVRLSIFREVEMARVASKEA